jgi:CyaY protein
MRRRSKGNKFLLRYAERVEHKMTELEFRTLADQTLEDLNRRLSDAAGDLGCEADFNGGALVIEFEDSGTKFVVSPNAPVKQVWVSANLKSYKLDWDPAREAFALADGPVLADLMAHAISEHTGKKVGL